MNKILKTIIYSLAVLNSLGSAYAKPEIITENLRVILPPSVASSTAAYGVIKNNGDEPDLLVNISSDAGMVMLHQTKIEAGNAKMIHVDGFLLEPGKSLVLKPMSYHIMLMNINHDIVKKSGTVAFTFEFQKSGELKIMVPVESN